MFVPLGATAMEVDTTVAFPEAAKPLQRIKLPGQNRVTADEYQEFITLGQGGIFDLDLDRVVQAPWKEPYSEMGAFFNYGMNPARWRAYARDVHTACAQMRLQDPIHLYHSLVLTHSDPDLPPELKTTLLAKGLINSAASFRSAAPAPRGDVERALAPDSIIHLAGSISQPDQGQLA